MPDPSQVTLEGARCVQVRRSFDAPRAALWRAFTETDLLQSWLLGPPGWQMHVCEMNLREGGGYRWRWRNAQNGEEFGFSGTYLVVIPGQRLEDRQSFDHGPDARPMGEATENRVTFASVEGGTQVTTRVSYPNQAARDMVLAQGMADGMEMSYRRLDALLPSIFQARA